MPGTRPRPKPNSLAARGFLVAALAALMLLGQGPGGDPGSEAMTEYSASRRQRKLPWRSGPREKTLLSLGSYELKYLPRGKGSGPISVMPRLKFQQIPAKVVSLKALGTSIEGDTDKDYKTFPFSTQNNANLHLLFPRLSGDFSLSAEDPPVRNEVNSLDEPPKTLKAKYKQELENFGSIGMDVDSAGQWTASFAREFEDLGHVSGAVNSQLDWQANLEQAYRPFKGVSPRVTYGVNQDGMRVKAQFDHAARNRKGRGWSRGLDIRSRYLVQNKGGNYKLPDVMHEGRVSVSSKDGKRTVEARGEYDRHLSKIPVRGSLSAKMETRPGTFEASVDYDRYRLKAKTKYGEASAAIGTGTDRENRSDDAWYERFKIKGGNGRTAEKGGHGLSSRPAEFDLKVGRVSARTSFGEGKPKVRFNVDVVDPSRPAPSAQSATRQVVA